MKFLIFTKSWNLKYFFYFIDCYIYKYIYVSLNSIQCSSLHRILNSNAIIIKHVFSKGSTETVRPIIFVHTVKWLITSKSSMVLLCPWYNKSVSV
jgi:hypothetical protein